MIMNIFNIIAFVTLILTSINYLNGSTFRSLEEYSKAEISKVAEVFGQIQKIKKSCNEKIKSILDSKQKIHGYGASTKGNVILQYCDIGPDLLPFIGDITPFKDGAFTPGTKIPIISMEKAKAMKPDYFLVLPWAFRNDILQREKETIQNRIKFIFPLPFVEIVC